MLITLANTKDVRKNANTAQQPAATPDIPERSGISLTDETGSSLYEFDVSDKEKHYRAMRYVKAWIRHQRGNGYNDGDLFENFRCDIGL